MKKSILFSVLVVGATLLQAQSITVHQTCGQNGQVVKVIPPEAVQAMDLGLSIKWATCNVGAELPEGYGGYYSWGETKQKTYHTWNLYFDTRDDGSTFVKYNNDGGKTTLDPEDDVAHISWGGHWRMPTKAEWEELKNNCTWTWTTLNGINGYKVTSKKDGYTNKSIFLPAAGQKDPALRNAGSCGNYWSSSLVGNNAPYAKILYISSSSSTIGNSSRYKGNSVRPVLPYSSAFANDTIRIYSDGCDDYQTFIGSSGSQLTMNAASAQWSHFVRWQDGNTDNPRTITTNGNTNYTAYFETYKFSVNVQSTDPTKGSGYISKVVNAETIEYNKSVGTFDAGSEVYLAFQANYGYHFVKWSDGNTSQQRSFILSKDTVFTADFANNTYYVTANSAHAEQGTVSGPSQANYLDNITLTANPKYGYHFAQWSDGNKTNPRNFVITKDTTFTAEFAKNTYTISTTSANPEWGTTTGGKSALYLDEVEISATANYGYHFVKWNDNNTSNPRTVSVTKDKTYTATFAKNVYSITKNAEHGSISGNNSAEYLDYVTLTVVPDYGYHFTQWSDGVTDNPRTIILTQDTTFTAEFAVDKSGTCGKNNLLQWRFADDGTLTISGSGELTENYTFGVEAPTQMQQLVVGNEVTAIGERAFYEKTTLQKLIIGSNVTSIGKYAFASINNRQLTSLVMPSELLTIGDYAFSGNTYVESVDFNAKLQSIGAYAFKDCYRVSEMTCLATVTPDLGTDALASINSYASLCVPEECLKKYKVDPNWGRFDLCSLGTTSTVTDSRTVTVEPSDNTAIFTWPMENNAASYSLQITKDGVVFCTLVFNSNGQLTGIAFAPSRNDTSHAPAATTSIAGMSFTVTGLNGASKYAYRLAIADASNTQIIAYTGEFATIGYSGEVNPGGNPEGIEDIFIDEHKASKILHDGQIFILRGNKTFTLQGQEVK